jgi:Enoyl-CoA hydratase/isomerase
MVALSVEPVSIAEATELLENAAGGTEDFLGSLNGDPILAVDLDTPGDATRLRPHQLLPCVTVGVGGARDDAAHLDVLVTSEPSPGSPWVGVRDTTQALELLVHAALARPSASATLVQVLRAGRHGSLDDDLMTESLAYSTLQGGAEFASWMAEHGRRRQNADRCDAVDAVLLERTHDTLVITLNRPAVRNAYNAAMRDQLCEALGYAVADDSITEISLEGAGPAFCSGGDLDEFGASTDSGQAHLVRVGRSAARMLSLVSDRLTARLHGACIGAGIELPALARRVIAAPDTFIQLPEVSMGLIPGAGGTATIPRRIGRQRTAWLALTGERIGADAALAWGLVDEIA